MGASATTKEIARWVALGGLFLIPFTPFIVTSTLFFPFITGKAFFFRIVVEIAVAGWAILAILDKAYRPRFSGAAVAVLAFVAWMFVADLFAVNVLKAFWSNFERMEGWVLLAHLLGFFFAASSVLGVEKKWRAWFLASLGVSLLISLYALLQLSGALAIHQGATRIDATLGNSAYLAIYFLFNAFIAGWLALTEARPWLKWSLGILAVVETILIFFTETRGTILALTGALFLSAVLTLVVAGGKVRRYAAIAAAVIVLLAGGFYAARDSAFVQGNHVLQRVASISLADGQTRFTIWGIAYRGFLERPIVGWGQEGFNYVFNTYYVPSMYQQEPWFDRAHNAFLDWLMAGGLPAFLLYLSLFGTALWFLWRSPALSRPERIALTGALAGYAVHNLFVFDNLYSYVYFFAILALIHSQVSRPIRFFERTPDLAGSEGATYVLPVALAVLLGTIWFVNIPGINAAATLITAITPSNTVSANIDAFQKLLANPPFAAQEIREQLVSFETSALQSSSVSNEDKQRIATLTVTEMRKQVAEYPRDAREHLELAYAYRAAGDVEDAYQEIMKALALSPKKEAIWIQAGILEWDRGNVQAARDNFAKAYELGPQFSDLATYAAAGEYGAGNAAAGDALLKKTFGTTVVDSDILAVAYYRTKDWPRLIALWQQRASAPGASIQTRFGLAAAYYAAGQKGNAIAVLQKVAADFPEAAASVQQAIAQIQSGK